jgi:site-specific DNA-methyltransferase (adenine-specific)
MSEEWKNKLYFGDNLEWMRDPKAFPDESVDLIYLDPPFNSKADYNVLYKEVDGTPSAAQFQAFTDFWHWDEKAARTLHELTEKERYPHAPAALVELLLGFEKFLGHNDMFAYLVMMAPRLVEMRRVLKPTGSIYLHCDPTASHYVKLVLDSLFGGGNYRNEVIWQRTSAHPNTGKRYGGIADILLFYTRSAQYTWNMQYTEYTDDHVRSSYRHQDQKGRYALRDLTALMLHASSGQLYTWKGKKPPPSRCWAYTKAQMERLDAEGRIRYSRTGNPRLKVYLDEMPGIPLQNIWTDIGPVQAHATEKLGFQTQKPIALLERIISASSNPGEIVLDPFCGCGTTVAAAQKLGRRWIGIDVTHLAIDLIEYRLNDMYGDEIKKTYEVHGVPKDWESAKALATSTDHPRKEFELWALSLVSARPKGDPDKKGGGDRGIDGIRFFVDGKKRDHKKVIIQVKSDEHPTPSYVRDLVGTMKREEAEIGALVTLYPPTQGMKKEAASHGFFTSAITGRDFPRVQILTIDGLLKGHERLEIPLRSAPDVTFSHTDRVKQKADQEKLDLD